MFCSFRITRGSILIKKRFISTWLSKFILYCPSHCKIKTDSLGWRYYEELPQTIQNHGSKQEGRVVVLGSDLNCAYNPSLYFCWPTEKRLRVASSPGGVIPFKRLSISFKLPSIPFKQIISSFKRLGISVKHYESSLVQTKYKL